MPTPAELLRTLSERGEPRGASAVFSAAVGDRRPPTALLAAAALVVAVTAAAIGISVQDEDASTIGALQRAEIEDSDGAVTPATDAPQRGPSTPDDPPIGPSDDGAVSGLSDTPAITTHLESHRSCDGVLHRLRALGVEAVGPTGFSSTGRPAISTAGEAADSTDAPAGDATYARSNVQEPGVDEADLVKTDGTIVVALARDRLQVVSVADRSLLASLELGVPPSSLFLVDSTVVVIGEAVWGGERHEGPETPVVVVDLADASRPTVRSTTWIEGVVRSSRLQAGVVRLVTGDSPRFRWKTPSDSSDAAAQQAEAENRRIVEQSSLDVWLPDYRTVDAEGRQVDAGAAASCRATYTPSEQSGFETTTVVTLDPRTGTLDPGTSIAATPIVVYASEQSLYVVSTTCCSEEQRNVSDVHRFDLSSPTAAPYRSSGSVKGVPVDQFALSERSGHLRIATTYVTDSGETPDDRSPMRDVGTDSAIWVLTESGTVLEAVGSITGLGEEGERIHSVRYQGTHAYVVTFRRTDPLYVIDLTDPRSPTLRGELHVPGFSTFLQHVGEGRLVGVGRDADDEGRAEGLQLSLFDVSDPESPTRKDALGYERGASSAEHDHLAFLHWAPTDLVVVPLFEANATGDCDVFAGAVLIHVDGSSLTEAGRVTHARHVEDDDGSAAIVPIVRSTVAGGSLVTMSNLGVAFSDLSDGTEQHFVTFQGPESGVERFGCRAEPRKPGEEPDEDPTITIPM